MKFAFEGTGITLQVLNIDAGKSDVTTDTNSIYSLQRGVDRILQKWKLYWGGTNHLSSSTYQFIWKPFLFRNMPLLKLL